MNSHYYGDNSYLILNGKKYKKYILIIKICLESISENLDQNESKEIYFLKKYASITTLLRDLTF